MAFLTILLWIYRELWSNILQPYLNLMQSNYHLIDLLCNTIKIYSLWRIKSFQRIESYEFSEFIWLTAFIQIIPFARNATEHFTSRRISPSRTMNHNISPILWFILNCFLHWPDVNASCIYAMDFISGSVFS